MCIILLVLQDGGSEKIGGRGPVVSLTSQRGLTVSIKNNIAGGERFSGYRKSHCNV